MSSQQEETVKIASPFPVIFAGLLNGGIFCLVWYLAYTKGVEPSRWQVFSLNVGFLLAAVVTAQIFFRRSLATKVTFTKLFVSGWVSSLFFAIVIAVFYSRFFPSIGENAPPLAQILIPYSFLGLVFSAIVAFFISRKN